MKEVCATSQCLGLTSETPDAPSLLAPAHLFHIGADCISQTQGSVAMPLQSQLHVKPRDEHSQCGRGPSVAHFNLNEPSECIEFTRRLLRLRAVAATTEAQLQADIRKAYPSTSAIKNIYRFMSAFFTIPNYANKTEAVRVIAAALSVDVQSAGNRMCTKEERVRCAQCQKLITKHNLTTHINEIHNDKKFKCDQCSYSAARKANLVSHVKNMHSTGAKPKYPCEFPGCKCTFKYPSNMKKHFRKAHHDAGSILPPQPEPPVPSQPVPSTPVQSGPSTPVQSGPSAAPQPGPIIPARPAPSIPPQRGSSTSPQPGVQPSPDDEAPTQMATDAPEVEDFSMLGALDPDCLIDSNPVEREKDQLLVSCMDSFDTDDSDEESKEIWSFLDQDSLRSTLQISSKLNNSLVLEMLEVVHLQGDVHLNYVSTLFAHRRPKNVRVDNGRVSRPFKCNQRLSHDVNIRVDGQAILEIGEDSKVFLEIPQITFTNLPGNPATEHAKPDRGFEDSKLTEDLVGWSSAASTDSSRVIAFNGEYWAKQFIYSECFLGMKSFFHSIALASSLSPELTKPTAPTGKRSMHETVVRYRFASGKAHAFLCVGFIRSLGRC